MTAATVPVWVMHLEDDSTINLCESHALSESNKAFAANGYAPAANMSEAVLILDMVMAMNGDPQSGNLITYSEAGECDACTYARIKNDHDKETA